MIWFVVCCFLSTGKVAMTTGDQSQKTLTLRDPANSWSQDWQVNLTSNGYPGYRVIVDPDHDKILVGDTGHDENGTDDGLIRVFNDDGTVNITVINPTSTNTRFGGGFAVKNGKLVSTVRVGGSSSNMALQFMTLTYGGGGGGGSQWWGTRGMAIGGQQPGISNIMQYFDITSTGNAVDFGDLTTIDYNSSAGGNGSRGVRIGGTSNNTTMDYWAFATPGNAVDFGDPLVARQLSTTVADGTKAITGGSVAGGYKNDIEYITVATTGNGTDFGDLNRSTAGISSTNDTTRGVFAGDQSTSSNAMDYITMATPGNATD